MDPNAVAETFRRTVTEHYLDFQGRCARREFWYYVLAYFVIYIGLAIIQAVIGTRVLTGLFGLALLLPGIGISVRRLHDTDRSGWSISDRGRSCVSDDRAGRCGAGRRRNGIGHPVGGAVADPDPRRGGAPYLLVRATRHGRQQRLRPASAARHAGQRRPCLTETGDRLSSGGRSAGTRGKCQRAVSISDCLHGTVVVSSTGVDAIERINANTRLRIAGSSSLR